ncbi:MAG: toxin HipA [Spartobacteria bacterium]|nr:toxin HipA [Spartobacteria bacterium]
MRSARVYMHAVAAGILMECDDRKGYTFGYDADYQGPPISRTLPVRQEVYSFDGFPAVFDGWLPEGAMLEALLRERKIDRFDSFSQLVAVGHDLVGAVTVSMPGDEL